MNGWKFYRDPDGLGVIAACLALGVKQKTHESTPYYPGLIPATNRPYDPVRGRFPMSGDVAVWFVETQPELSEEEARQLQPRLFEYLEGGS